MLPSIYKDIFGGDYHEKKINHVIYDDFSIFIF